MVYDKEICVKCTIVVEGVDRGRKLGVEDMYVEHIQTLSLFSQGGLYHT